MLPKEKAEIFRQLHLDKKLLVLPNAWDTVSAKLVEALGFHAVATASVATALTNGYEDGEKIPFDVLLRLVGTISSALTVPLTIDIEHGFADDLNTLKSNIQLLIENGAVGINIEDGKPGKQELETTDDQCKRIETIRITAEKSGVPIVINARTDMFLQRPGDENNLQEAISRANAYIHAGADCVYPVMINKYEHIQLLITETNVPVNVNLQKSVSDLKRLENIGVARISLGPGFLYYALGKMHDVAKDLQEYNTVEYFDSRPLSKEVLQKLLFKS